MMRRIRALLLAVLLLVVTGCAELPTTGPVEQVEMTLEPPSVDIAPEPPSPGMSVERLIEGFLLAMADSEGDYAVAREYLTPQASERWLPEAGAVIYEGELVGEQPVLEGRQIGALSQEGRYSPQAASLRHDFGLQQVEGEWRINLPPTGLLLSRFVFERYYSRVTTYFMSREGTHVVPDLRYLPESLVTPQAVVETQIAGPPRDLAPAVANALGREVRLSPEGASINADGVVSVDLVGLPTAMPEEARRQLGAQLLWSLTAVPRTTGLRITSEGRPFSLPGQLPDGVLELSSQQGYQVLNRASTPDLYAIVDGTLGMVTSTRDLDPLYEGLQAPVELAISIDATLAAVVEADRETLLLGTPKGGFTAVEHPYRNLRCPQFVLGELWVIADDEEGSPVVLVVSSRGDVTALPVELPEGHALRSMSVAQTGATAAAIAAKDGLTQLGLMTISGGDPRVVLNWRPLVPVTTSGMSLSGVREADWQGETSLAILASGAGADGVYLVQSDGSFVEDLMPGLGDIRQLTSLTLRSGGAVAVRADDDVVWRYEARTRWVRAADHAEVIAYAG